MPEDVAGTACIAFAMADFVTGQLIQLMMALFLTNFAIQLVKR